MGKHTLRVIIRKARGEGHSGHEGGASAPAGDAGAEAEEGGISIVTGSRAGGTGQSRTAGQSRGGPGQAMCLQGRLRGGAEQGVNRTSSRTCDLGWKGPCWAGRSEALLAVPTQQDKMVPIRGPALRFTAAWP